MLVQVVLLTLNMFVFFVPKFTSRGTFSECVMSLESSRGVDGRTTFPNTLVHSSYTIKGPFEAPCIRAGDPGKTS